MVKEVIWSQKADRELARMLSYLQDEISEQAAERLIAAIDKRIEQLKKQPEIGRRVLNKQTVCYLLVTKHRQMFYRLNGTTLHITAFFDTRQNPNKRPY